MDQRNYTVLNQIGPEKVKFSPNFRKIFRVVFLTLKSGENIAYSYLCYGLVGVVDGRNVKKMTCFWKPK